MMYSYNPFRGLSAGTFAPPDKTNHSTAERSALPLLGLLRQTALACCLLILSVTGAWAQSRTIAGKVTSQDDGSTLPGVNVLVKGTTSGVVTNADGGYSISVPGNDAV